MKKAIIPILVFVLLAALGFTVVYFNGAKKRFSIPGRDEQEAQITKLGYQVGELDPKTLEFFGVEPFTELYAVVDSKDDKANWNMDVNYVYRNYTNTSDALKTMTDYYEYARYAKDNGDIQGKVELFNDSKKGKAYILYDANVRDSLYLTDFAIRASTGSLYSDKEHLDYVYGGIYMDGTRVVCITTTNGLKSKEIREVLKNLNLPTP